MNRCLLLLAAVWLWLCAPVVAQGPPTLATALGDLIDQGQALKQQLEGQSPQPTWGQSEVLGDVQRCVEGAQQLRAGLGGTPASLHAQREQFGAALDRLKTSRTLLSGDTLAHADTMLALGKRIFDRIRGLEYRFDGKAQPQGSNLADQSLEGPADLPVYDSPNALLIEARSVRINAQALGAPQSPYRVGRAWGGAPYLNLELDRLVRAAYDFETACSLPYSDVESTAAAYRKVVKAYSRVQGYGLWDNDWAGWQLQKSLDRLARFYAAVAGPVATPSPQP